MLPVDWQIKIFKKKNNAMIRKISFEIIYTWL
jgi:hypothetical protein